MVTLPHLWTSTPKVHMKVYNDISSRSLSNRTFEDIYNEVSKSDIKDDDDILATTRALVILRDERARRRS